MRHRILQQTFDLQLQNRGMAWPLQQQLAALYSNRLKDEMERQFTRLSSGAVTHRIDRLEVDLGALSFGEFESQFLDRFNQRLPQALAEAMTALSELQVETGAAAFCPPFEGYSAQQRTQTDCMLSKSDEALEMLRHFLVSGHLPWWSEQVDMDSFIEGVEQLFTDVPHKARPLFEQLIRVRNVRRRLVLQFPETALKRIASLLAPHFAESLDATMNELLPLLASLSPEFNARLLLWETSFDLLAAVETGPNVRTQLIASLVKIMAEERGAKVEDVAGELASSLVAENVATNKLAHEVAEELAALFGRSRNSSLATIDGQMVDPKGRAAPDDHHFTFRMAEDEHVRILFVDGSNGRRLPAGKNNVRVRYRASSDVDGKRQAVDAESELPQSDPKAKRSKESPGMGDGERASSASALQAGKSIAGSQVDSSKAEDAAKVGDTYRIISRPDVNSGESAMGHEPEVSEEGSPHPGRPVHGPARPPSPGEPVALRALRESRPAERKGKPRQDGEAHRQSPKEDELATEAIYIENAGAALFWPFFGDLFKTLRLVDDNGFCDESAQMRAIYLLQYLVTGEEGAPEYRLALNKILCGWEVMQPISSDFEILAAERQECENLQRAVISHWSALKNTSIEGLRDSFLIRNGRLFRKDQSWFLHVESKPQDLLMEKLPWTLSMVRLSWMREPLHVEWRGWL